jgi:hypothetical protein
MYKNRVLRGKFETNKQTGSYRILEERNNVEFKLY